MNSTLNLPLIRTLLLLAPLFSFSQLSASCADRPNIVLMMLDDFGYECVTANGGQSYHTPNIDHLATSGLRFENCHVQPLCTPTRVQMMTGRYNIFNYIRFGELPRTERTFAQLLKRAGYATAVCGKWQLGQEPDSPQHFGFDDALLWQHTRLRPRYANPGLEHNAHELDYSTGEYAPELINDFALHFITKHRAQPFFLYYPMILTHSPFQPTPDGADWDPALQGEKGRRDVKHFADMTAYADKMVGRVVDKLDELGIRDNTLLIVVGDNGTQASVISRFQGEDYQGGKGKTTSNGTHVPLIVSWPAVMTGDADTPGGNVCEDLISSTDFLPTMCAAAGIAVPVNVDGVSFLPQLRGMAGSPRDWLYTWYSPRQKVNLSIQEYAFDKNFKLYRSGQFYDLQADPAEERDLSGALISNQPLSAQAISARAKLQDVLDQFTAARPIQLDQQFMELGPAKAGRK